MKESRNLNWAIGSRGWVAALGLVVVTGLVGAMGCEPGNPSGAAGGKATPVASLTNVGLTDDGWYQSYSQALEKSKETGKPMLIDFTGSDWCHWCVKLDEEVFSQAEFKTWADENVVLLKLDYPRKTEQMAELKQQNETLQAKFKIQGFPTVMFVDGTEKTIGQYGYDQGGPSVWTKKASEIIGG
jgi:protein disulfide-isomerase